MSAKELAKKTPNAALHAKHGNIHLVGIGNLKVVVIQDGDFWFAQGLEIDYASEGKNFEEVKTAFETDFAARSTNI